MSPAIDDRRERVHRLMLKHLSTREIAQSLGVTEKTVANDMASIRERIGKWIAANPEFAAEKVKLTFQQIESLNQVEREAWLLYHDTPMDKAGVKAKCLDVIKMVVAEKSRLLGLQDSEMLALEAREDPIERVFRAVVLRRKGLSEPQMSGGLPSEAKPSP